MSADVELEQLMQEYAKAIADEYPTNNSRIYAHTMLCLKLDVSKDKFNPFDFVGITTVVSFEDALHILDKAIKELKRLEVKDDK